MKVGSDDEADELLRAMAHPARRQILRHCWTGPVSAGGLTEAIGLAAPSVSEHLRVLRKTGLVLLTKNGTFRHYQTNVELVAAIARWIAHFPHEGQRHDQPHRPL